MKLHTDSRRFGLAGGKARGRAGMFTVLCLCLSGIVAPALAGEKVGGRERAALCPIGDETIGTLPIMGGGPLVQLRRDLEVVRPSFFIEGNLDGVCNAIVTLVGADEVQVVPLDPAYTRVRLIFPDHVFVGFDRTLMQSSDFKIGMWLPEPRADADTLCAWGPRLATIAQTNARIELPVIAMSAAGALDQTPLLVLAAGGQVSTQLTAATDSDFLYLFQRH